MGRARRFCLHGAGTVSEPIIAVIGLGYIGLPTAAVLAQAGYETIGIDNNSRVVDIVNTGAIHIVEPGLEEVVRAAVAKRRLRASTVPVSADAFMIAVPTPFMSDKSPDLSFVKSACEAIAPVLTAGNTVILESTSPVGATEKVAQWIAACRPDLVMPGPGKQGDISIAYCPERVLPGRVLHELVANDRVIGGLSPDCALAARAIYARFVKGECILTQARTAEMCKLTENAFRDVNIAFANELSLICSRLEIDVWELITLANRHPRVNILQPGPGVGGHCIACDPWFIVSSAPEEARLIRTAREVNDAKPNWVLDQVAAAVTEIDLGRPALIACYGLSFKPDIDDLRDSPALHIARELNDRGAARILAVEPHIDCLPPSLSGVELVDWQAAAVADIHLLLVDHTAFKSLPVPTGRRIDTRGMGW